MMFRNRDDGFQFDSGLALGALGKSGADREFYVLPLKRRSCWRQPEDRLRACVES